MNNFKDYKIRKAESGDVLDLHNIYLTTWLNTYPNKELNITEEDIKFKFESRLTPEKIEERKLKISNIGENELMLVVEKDNELIALCNAVQREIIINFRLFMFYRNIRDLVSDGHCGRNHKGYSIPKKTR